MPPVSRAFSRHSLNLISSTPKPQFSAPNCRTFTSAIGPAPQQKFFRTRQPPQFFRTFHVSQTATSKKQPQPFDTEELSLRKKAAKMAGDDHFLTLSCPDKSGIVYAVTGLLAQQNFTILDLQQFSDPDSKKFFMRVHFGHATDLSALQAPLQKLAGELQMSYQVRPVQEKPKVLLMVSKIGHCLNDLLFRVKSGQLKIDVPLIVSNHPEFKALAESYGIPFHHLPVTKDTKEQQESQILELIAQHKIELVVLARYMQVLSPRLCSEMSGKIINIHHSFLPSFKGAKPYHQAYERGVKIIGATAHFVTADLDEGPIIEQRVARVDHAMSPKELVEEGSNVESQVLAAAVKWWSEQRVLLNGAKTVVFN
ncbi:Formyltetrahydrofolate deformylase [Bimuria novae-zelandiae CBS 107.79]|uniref:Formyltetrahydrofolate deformylase n=1 Tax=Bimuria novae-zelandiae CBS 107.79 TaxID=1447943 RepID=A0A6A5V1Y8_9PLEO|nr:Formyltetrahydrofolate deformylase [Bimuria novae-zelandiae CBS 107.79]